MRSRTGVYTIHYPPLVLQESGGQGSSSSSSSLNTRLWVGSCVVVAVLAALVLAATIITLAATQALSFR